MSLPVIESWKHTREEKRAIALKRAVQLKRKISDYLDERDNIKSGFDLQEIAKASREKILSYFKASSEDWQDWRWHMAHRINHEGVLQEIMGFSGTRCDEVAEVKTQYRWAISPYYASLMEPGDSADPIALQAVPCIQEMVNFGHNDPMAEEFTSPAPCITRRYPDRLIINVTNCCAMYCRHCQRRRNIGEVDSHAKHKDLLGALEYIRKNKEIRDVLITGGDALMLSDGKIDWLLGELGKINHVEIKRLGTRAIVTLPQRVTPELCLILKRHSPLYINTQFNHPREITPESKRACDMLVEAGVVLGNQAVLLKGVNNHSHIMKRLNHELLKIRVRPYYIFHAKSVKGTSHFITTVNQGLEIMENLRGYTSGLAVPTYIINAPGGYGKVPVLPRYLLKSSNYSVRLRNWEGREIDYRLLPEAE